MSGRLKSCHRVADRQPNPEPIVRDCQGSGPKGWGRGQASPTVSSASKGSSHGLGGPSGDQESCFCVGRPWAPWCFFNKPSRLTQQHRLRLLCPRWAGHPPWVSGLPGRLLLVQKEVSRGTVLPQACSQPPLCSSACASLTKTHLKAQPGFRVEKQSAFRGRAQAHGRGWRHREGYGIGANLLPFWSVPTQAGRPPRISASLAPVRKSACSHHKAL